MRKHYWWCNDCTHLNQTDVSAKQCVGCGKERGTRAGKGPGIVFNLKKAEREGAISTYQEGQHSDFYVNELLMGQKDNF